MNGIAQGSAHGNGKDSQSGVGIMNELHPLVTYDREENILSGNEVIAVFYFGRKGWTSIEDNPSTFETFEYFARVKVWGAYSPQELTKYQDEMNKRLPEVGAHSVDKWVHFMGLPSEWGNNSMSVVI